MVSALQSSMNWLVNLIVVLILIMLEGGFCSKNKMNQIAFVESVLILIMLEGGFCFDIVIGEIKQDNSLNPYYAGRWFLLVCCNGSKKTCQVRS